METDHETWLIHEGDRIINKKSREGCESLSSLAKAIYYLWIVDYAIRNSGTLEPMRRLNKKSISELMLYSEDNGCDHLYLVAELAKDEQPSVKIAIKILIVPVKSCFTLTRIGNDL